MINVSHILVKESVHLRPPPPPPPTKVPKRAQKVVFCLGLSCRTRLFSIYYGWNDVNTILSNARRALKNNPPKDKVGGSMEVFIDQLYSPKVSEARQEALKKRWQIKQKHPDWSVFLKYPARIFVKTPRGRSPRAH